MQGNAQFICKMVRKILAYIERHIFWQSFEMQGRIAQVTPSCQVDHRPFWHTQQPHTTVTLTYANTIRSLQVNKSVTISLLILYSVRTKEKNV